MRHPTLISELINLSIFLLENTEKHTKRQCTQSCPTLVTPLTGACQAPLSMGFFRQEYWSGLPFPSPGDIPDLGIEPRSPALQADSLPTGGGVGGRRYKNKKANRTGSKSGMIKINGGSNWIHFAMAPWPLQALNNHMRF